MESGSRLILIRHAKSDYPWGVPDHDRPLNERGRRDAPEIGAWLDANVSWPVGAAPHARVSTARRAQLTWGLARTRLSSSWDDVPVTDDPAMYGAEQEALLEVVASATGVSTLILVGHNPGLVDLVAHLSADGELCRQATAKFPTSAIAVLSSRLPLDDACRLRDFQVSAFAVPRG